MRLLFIRFSSIGDIVLTTPAIRCAKQQIPGVEIHFLTKRSMKEITEANPYIDHFHYLDNDLNETIQSLKHINFDHIIDLHNNLRTFKIKQALKAKATSYRKLSLLKLLLVKLHLNFLPDAHVCDRYMDTLKSFGVQYDGQGLDYFLPESFVNNPIELPPTHQGDFAALVIGASYFTKKMPSDKLVELCNKMEYPIVLIGGKEDQAVGDLIASSNPSKIFNTSGMLSMNGSAAVIKRAKLVLSNDTGFLHVACAFKKPTVIFWGATTPVLQFGAYYPLNSEVKSYNAIVPDLICQPCSKQGTHKCPKGHFNCMRLQDTQQIANKANEFYSH